MKKHWHTNQRFRERKNVRYGSCYQPQIDGIKTLLKVLWNEFGQRIQAEPKKSKWFKHQYFQSYMRLQTGFGCLHKHLMNKQQFYLPL